MLALLLLAAIQWSGGEFRVTGWEASSEPPAGWPSVFNVYASPTAGASAGTPPLLGAYSVDAGVLVFHPRFPLAPGMYVRAVFQPPQGEAVEAAFEIPASAPRTPSTRVSQVYPSSSTLPANALKLYLYFDAPMMKGDSWKHIHLLCDGKPVEYPFLELDQELWDREQKRFTVLFDPGRIKRGLASLAEAGPAMEAGRTYTLVIDRDWLDGRGVPLASEYRKTFRSVAEDRLPPNPRNWRVTAPRAGTSDALVIRFPEALDYALLQHEIEVAGVDGNVEVAREETEWRFTPTGAWRAGSYQIVVRTTLEDRAGNHVNRPFDVDTFDPITRKVTADTVSLPLRIR
ncbi:MAG: hypothetical protein ABI759_25785 [Candidatus Solibacter sp.]